MSLFPYAVVLQVTPIVAIAPLIIIWTNNNIPLSLLICAWIVAFFPILSNTILGLNSVDHNLINLFQMYGATRGQTLRYLRLAGGAAVFPRRPEDLRRPGADRRRRRGVRGRHGRRASGLAYSILEAGFQLKIPRMFAALLLISLSGIAIFLITSWISHLLLRRWHESAVVAGELTPIHGIHGRKLTALVLGPAFWFSARCGRSAPKLRSLDRRYVPVT